MPAALRKRDSCSRKWWMCQLCSCGHLALQESRTFPWLFNQLCSIPSGLACSKTPSTIVKLKQHHPRALSSHPLNKTNDSKPYPWSTDDEMMKIQTVLLYGLPQILEAGLSHIVTGTWVSYLEHGSDASGMLWETPEGLMTKFFLTLLGPHTLTATMTQRNLKSTCFGDKKILNWVHLEPISPA